MGFRMNGWVTVTLLLGAWPVLSAEKPSKSVASGVSVIKTISADQSSEGGRVNVVLDKAMKSPPRSFTYTDPPRMVIDLFGAVNGTGQTLLENLTEDVRKIELQANDGRTRAVLYFNKAVEASLVTEAGQVSVKYSHSKPAAGMQDKSASAVGIEKIDFKRARDGSGRVVLDLMGTTLQPDVRTEGRRLVMDFFGAELPTALQKRFDVSDFGTPVMAFEARKTKNGVRVVLDTQGFFRHSGFMEGRQFILEVQPSDTDPTQTALLGKSNEFKGEKITLNIQNGEIRSLLQIFAEFSNMNIIASDSVKGTASLRLKNVPWDQGLDLLLKSKGLVMRKNGSVLMVAPADEVTKREREELAAKVQSDQLEPLLLENFVLQYQKADDVISLLTSSGGGGGGVQGAAPQGGNANAGILSSLGVGTGAGSTAPTGGGVSSSRLLSPRGSAVRHQGTNQIFVQDTAESLERIRKVIAKIDVPVRQVMIEARIVIAKEGFSRELGVKLGLVDKTGVSPDGYGGRFKFGPSQQAVGGNLGQGGGTNAITGDPILYTGPGRGTFPKPSDSGFDYGPYNFVNLPAANGAAANKIAFSLFNATATQFLNLELSALEAENNGKVVSSPRIVTADQAKAVIEQGTEIPYTVAGTANSPASVAFKSALMKLEVTPQITPEGAVILEVDIAKDSPGQQVQGNTSIEKKHVNTKVLVENSGTVVIGGIFDSNETSTVNKTPFFGDLPFIGNLFKNTIRSNDKTELLVFLTPRVLEKGALK